MLAAGIAGGYTTWSPWAWESLALGEDGSLVELTAHIAGSRVVAWPRPMPPAVPPEVIVVRLVSATRRPTVLYAHHDRGGRPATKGPDALPGGSQSPPTDFRQRRASRRAKRPLSPGARRPARRGLRRRAW